MLFVQAAKEKFGRDGLLNPITRQVAIINYFSPPQKTQTCTLFASSPKQMECKDLLTPGILQIHNMHLFSRLWITTCHHRKNKCKILTCSTNWCQNDHIWCPFLSSLWLILHMVHANLTSYIVPKQQTFPLDHWPRFYFSIKQECFSIDLLRFCSTDLAYLYVLNPYVSDLSQENPQNVSFCSSQTQLTHYFYGTLCSEAITWVRFLYNC